MDHIKAEAEIKIKELQEKKLNVIMWGVGSRGISFLNRFPLDETNMILFNHKITQGDD